jgi:hypothetical protein
MRNSRRMRIACSAQNNCVYDECSQSEPERAAINAADSIELKGDRH